MCNVLLVRKAAVIPLRLITAIFFISLVFYLFQNFLLTQEVFAKARNTRHSLFIREDRKHFENEKEILWESKNNLGQSQIRKNVVKKCKAGRGVLFVKTHKTGSTTITNIVLRYALKYRLSIGLPLPRHWQLGGYPAKFDSRLILPHLHRYEVLCHHLRYDHSAVRRVLRPDVFALTVLRDPSEGFESGFAFFRDWPFPKWFKNVSAPENLQLFLNQPYAYYNTSTPWYFRAKNYMAFDLGFDHEKNEFKYAEFAIQKVEQWFDLVMITERMDESLILLKDHLCLDDYEDIAYLRLKVRQNFARRHVNKRMRDQIRAWNLLDTRLYNYFNKTLTKKIERFGKARMTKALKEFGRVLEQLKTKCVQQYDQYHMKPWVSRIKLKENSGELCEMLSWGEVRFGDYLRQIQRTYVNVDHLRQPSAEEVSRLFENAQKSVIGAEAAKNSF